MSEEKKQSFVCEAFGAPLAPNDARDYKAKLGKDAKKKEYPKEFDLFSGLNIKIKNQLGTNSCVAHAVSTVVEYFHKKQENENAEMSTGYIYGNRDYTAWLGEGMYTRDALKTVSKCGDAFWQDMPNNLEIPEAVETFNARDTKMDEAAYHNRISSYYRLKDIDSMKEQLMTVGPIVIAVDWHPYEINKWGVLHWKPNTKSEGGHCMVIRGWNSDGWLVQNSWGEWWGKKGLCVLPYSMKLRETWGVSDSVVGETGGLVVKPANKFIKAFYKIINLYWQVVYFFKKRRKK